MPRDPFEPDEGAGIGTLGEILGEAGLLLDALREAQARGRLIEAVMALDIGDLRHVVLERLITEAFRDGLGRDEGAGS
jgi:hypothetical protein